LAFPTRLIPCPAFRRVLVVTCDVQPRLEAGRYPSFGSLDVWNAVISRSGLVRNAIQYSHFLLLHFNPSVAYVSVSSDPRLLVRLKYRATQIEVCYTHTVRQQCTLEVIHVCEEIIIPENKARSVTAHTWTHLNRLTVSHLCHGHGAAQGVVTSKAIWDLATGTSE
jgi:hypothetical protein